MLDNLKSLGVSFVVGFIIAFVLGYKLFSKQEPPAIVSASKAEEKKAGIITVYDNNCPGQVPRIASVESYNSDVKSSESVQSKPEEKHNAVSYIPKYNFGDNKIYHSGMYSYDNYGIYLAENKEIGAVFTFRW